MKKTVKQNINEVRKLAKVMPKSLNEAIYEDFQYSNEEDPQKKMAPQFAPQAPEGDDENTNIPAPAAEPAQDAAPAPAEAAGAEAGAAPAGDMGEGEDATDNPASEKARGLIDDIRKTALRAMADLADDPESPEYENLKRIWSLCDRAVSEKQEQKEILQKTK
jgi:hypothetical protein